MKIIDINGKEKNAITVKRIIHQVKDINGEDVPTEYVECQIEGRTKRRWPEWIPLAEFVKANPHIKIEER